MGSSDEYIRVDNGDGTIEIKLPDMPGYGDDAYLTVDGKLIWKKDVRIGKDMLFEQVVFEKQ